MKNCCESHLFVIPAQAGIQGRTSRHRFKKIWTPAFAGVTEEEAGVTKEGVIAP